MDEDVLVFTIGTGRIVSRAQQQLVGQIWQAPSDAVALTAARPPINGHISSLFYGQ